MLHIVKKLISFGTLALKILSSKGGYITDAYVDPDNRRNKILTGLEEYALTELRNRGANKVELDVKSEMMLQILPTYLHSFSGTVVSMIPLIGLNEGRILMKFSKISLDSARHIGTFMDPQTAYNLRRAISGGKPTEELELVVIQTSFGSAYTEEINRPVTEMCNKITTKIKQLVGMDVDKWTTYNTFRKLVKHYLETQGDKDKERVVLEMLALLVWKREERKNHKDNPILKGVVVALYLCDINMDAYEVSRLEIFMAKTGLYKQNEPDFFS